MPTIHALSLLCLTSLSTLAQRQEIPLWPNGMPEPTVQSAEPERADRSSPGPEGFSLRKNVSKVRLIVFTPAEDRRTGAACVVVPGGGFGILADEHEGSEACEWLSYLGITAFLLEHRCPTNAHAEPNVGPVQDCQAAVALIRERAAEWKLDPAKIGALGFSAGGQVALVAANNPSRVQAGLKASHKPDFLLLLYPWRIYDEARKDLRADIVIDAKMPLFIAQAADDKSSLPQGSTLLYLKTLQERRPDQTTKPPELHLYSQGGHGFGMRPDKGGAPCPTDWPKRAADWLRGLGYGR